MYTSVFKALVVGSLHIEFVYPTLMIVLGQTYISKRKNCNHLKALVEYYSLGK